MDSAAEPGSRHEKAWFAEDATNREPLLKTYGFCSRNRAWWDHKRTPSNRWSIYLLDSASEPGSQHQKTVYCRKRNKPENLLKTYWVCTRNRPSWDHMRNPTNMVGLPGGFGLRARVATRKTLMSRKRNKPENLLKTHWFCNGNRGRWGLNVILPISSLVTSWIRPPNPVRNADDDGNADDTHTHTHTRTATNTTTKSEGRGGPPCHLGSVLSPPRRPILHMGPAGSRQEKTKKGHSFPLLRHEVLNPATLGPRGPRLQSTCPVKNLTKKGDVCPDSLHLTKTSHGLRTLPRVAGITPSISKNKFC